MAHARPGWRSDTRPSSPPIARRQFLSAGAACAVPIFAGTSFGRAEWGWPMAAQSQPSETDPVIDHVARELVRVCRAMQGVEGVKGEHVRTLASNLDLVAAHGLQAGLDPKLAAALNEGVGRSGREGFAQDLMMRHVEAIASISERYGLKSRSQLDLGRMAEAIDLAGRQDFTPVFERAARGLARLGAEFDRGRLAQVRVVRVGEQKPCDELGGCWTDVPPMGCAELRLLMHFMALTCGITGIMGAGLYAGIFGLLAEILAILYDVNCGDSEVV